MSMARTRSKVREDYKNYDPTHRFDSGAVAAYVRGEKPITYWSKKVIVDELSLVIDHADYNLAPIYRRHNITKTDLKKEINKLTKPVLVKTVLRRTGIHKTGNYYQNTSFYRVIGETELPQFVETHIIKPVEIVQLKLNI